MNKKLYIKGNSVVEEIDGAERTIVSYQDNRNGTTEQITSSFSQTLLAPFSEIHELLWSSLLYFLGCEGGELVFTEDWQRNEYKRSSKKMKMAIAAYQSYVW